MKRDIQLRTAIPLRLAATKRLYGILTLCLGTVTVALAAPPTTVDPDQIVDKLRVTYGTEARGKFKAGGDLRLKLDTDAEPGEKSALISVALKVTDATPVPVPGGGTRPYLVVTNGFEKPLHFRVLTRAKGSHEFIELADFLRPVPHEGNHIVKCWPIGASVEEVIIDQLTLADDTPASADGLPEPSKKAGIDVLGRK